MGGKGAHVGVFDLGVDWFVFVVQGRRSKKTQQLRGKALWGRQDGVMDPNEFGFINCFVEDV